MPKFLVMASRSANSCSLTAKLPEDRGRFVSFSAGNAGLPVNAFLGGLVVACLEDFDNRGKGLPSKVEALLADAVERNGKATESFRRKVLGIIEKETPDRTLADLAKERNTIPSQGGTTENEGLAVPERPEAL